MLETDYQNIANKIEITGKIDTELDNQIEQLFEAIMLHKELSNLIEVKAFIAFLSTKLILHAPFSTLTPLSSIYPQLVVFQTLFPSLQDKGVFAPITTKPFY